MVNLTRYGSRAGTGDPSDHERPGRHGRPRPAGEGPDRRWEPPVELMVGSTVDGTLAAELDDAADGSRIVVPIESDLAPQGWLVAYPDPGS